MTTSRQFSDDEGTFGEWRDHPAGCTRIVDGKPCMAKVQVRTWESSDGGYEDYQYRCANGHTFWIDGPDS